MPSRPLFLLLITLCFQVENLLENIDMKIEVKREKFLELNADYFTRVTKPIETALMMSSVTLNEISEVILMGAGTRVPKVQVCCPRNCHVAEPVSMFLCSTVPN
jgi:hypothetical protein